MIKTQETYSPGDALESFVWRVWEEQAETGITPSADRLTTIATEELDRSLYGFIGHA